MRPTIFLEVWRGLNGYAWSERLYTHMLEFKEEYDYHFAFFGKTASVLIGTDDDELTRKEALKIAIDHVKGNVIVTTIDLSLCGSLPERLRK